MSSFTSGWETLPPQTSAGKYAKYSNQLVVILSVTRKPKSNEVKQAKIYLTELVDKELKHPYYVRLVKRGNNIGLIPLLEDDGSCYAVARKQLDKNEQIGMPFINVNAYAKMFNWREGVYKSTHMDTGILVFDSEETPTRP